MRAIRDAESNNPVFMLDEIDKMGADFRGDPSSAMLEVLDPEQNNTFRDHYLDLPFDLSQGAVHHHRQHAGHHPRPLRDRMEVISIAGYTEEEKLHIAKRYLVPRQLERNGLKPGQLKIADDGSSRDHRGLHARGRGAQPGARDRHRVRASSPARWPRRGAGRSP